MISEQLHYRRKMMAQRPISDEMIRQWIQADESLYNEAVEYSEKKWDGPEKGTKEDPLPSGGECLQKFLYDFINENRKRLKDYIRERLTPKGTV